MNTTTDLEPQPNNPGAPIRVAPACTQTGYQPVDTQNALTGRDLRYVLTDYIGRGYRTIAQLVTKLAHDGYTVWGRASKIVSDALRWEIRNGRVKRVRRGLYAINTIPRTTLHRIRTRSQALFLVPHVVATRRNNPTTNTPKHTPPPDRHWREWHREDRERRLERPVVK